MMSLNDKQEKNTEKEGSLREISPPAMEIAFTNPIAKPFIAYKGKRHKMLSVNRRCGVINVEAVCFHPLEHRKILESAMQSKQSGQNRARLCSQRTGWSKKCGATPLLCNTSPQRNSRRRRIHRTNHRRLREPLENLRPRNFVKII